MTNLEASGGADSEVATAVPADISAPASAPAGSGRSWPFKVVVEVLLISLGVFLALTREQWRQRS